MRGLSLAFMVSAIIYVLAGMGFGVWMAANQDFNLSPAHGHLNLVGWVTMALFALYYHLVPQAAQTTLARIHFGVSTLAVWTMVPGIAMAVTGQGEVLAKVGSVFAVLSMVLFLAIVLRSRQPALA